MTNNISATCKSNQEDKRTIGNDQLKLRVKLWICNSQEFMRKVHMIALVYKFTIDIST